MFFPMPVYGIILHTQKAKSRTQQIFTRTCVCSLGHMLWRLCPPAAPQALRLNISLGASHCSKLGDRLWGVPQTVLTEESCHAEQQEGWEEHLGSNLGSSEFCLPLDAMAAGCTEFWAAPIISLSSTGALPEEFDGEWSVGNQLGHLRLTMTKEPLLCGTCKHFTDDLQSMSHALGILKWRLHCFEQMKIT